LRRTDVLIHLDTCFQHRIVEDPPEFALPSRASYPWDEWEDGRSHELCSSQVSWIWSNPTVNSLKSRVEETPALEQASHGSSIEGKRGQFTTVLTFKLSERE